MTREQCRAARALLGWGIEELAQRTDLSRNTISRFETGEGKPHRSTIKAIRTAFEQAGLEILANNDPSKGKGPGIRFLKERPH